MELREIMKKIQDIKKGTYVPIVYMTKIPSNKNHKDIIVTKMTRAVVRLGCSYEHLTSIKMAQKNTLALGEEIKTSTRVYDWLKEENGKSLFPFLYKGKNGVNLRCTIAHKVHYKPFKVLGYYANGKEISQKEAKTYTQPSAWKERTSAFDVFDKNINDIMILGK